MLPSDLAIVAAFVAVADGYCAFIERDPPAAVDTFLAEAEWRLPQLYGAALALPEPEASDSAWRDGMPHEAWLATFHRLQRVLGPHEYYRDIYDPAAMSDPTGAIDSGDEPVVGSLADDLADIWRDLHDGLARWPGAAIQERDDIVFTWRSSFGGHWGQHLVGALRAIHWWRHVHHLGERSHAPEA